MRVFISRKKNAPCAIDEALDRSRADVADRPGGGDGHRAHALAQRIVDGRRRSLLDHLLVAALQGAVALPEVDDRAVPIGEHLDLDVPRIVDVALDVDRTVGEVRLSLALGRRERALRLVRPAHDLHPAPAAARRRLDRDRPAERVAELDDLRGGRHALGGAGDDRDARRRHAPSRLDLRAHRLDRIGRRTDPDQSRLLAGAREARVLGEEPVARMDRLGTGCPGSREDALDREVALARARTDQARVIGRSDVPGSAVGLGVHGHGLAAELAQRAEHPDRDLTAIGDEHAAERRCMAANLLGRGLVARGQLRLHLHEVDAEAAGGERANEPAERGIGRALGCTTRRAAGPRAGRRATPRRHRETPSRRPATVSLPTVVASARDSSCVTSSSRTSSAGMRKTMPYSATPSPKRSSVCHPRRLKAASAPLRSRGYTTMSSRDMVANLTRPCVRSVMQRDLDPHDREAEDPVERADEPRVPPALALRAVSRRARPSRRAGAATRRARGRHRSGASTGPPMRARGALQAACPTRPAATREIAIGQIAERSKTGARRRRARRPPPTTRARSRRSGSSATSVRVIDPRAGLLLELDADERRGEDGPVDRGPVLVAPGRHPRRAITRSGRDAPSARATVRAFSRLSSYSARASESATIAPPTCRWARPSVTTAVRITTARSQAPSGASQPNAPAYGPAAHRLELLDHLHRAHLRAAGHRSGRERRRDRVQRVEARAEADPRPSRPSGAPSGATRPRTARTRGRCPGCRPG